MELAAGLAARVEFTVTDADTAQAVGSGDVPVLATPRVVALAEAATVVATAARLEAGYTTVGTRVEFDHLAATAVGRTVVADAHLVAVDGRKLTFEVSVYDGEEVTARGRVERAVVDRHRFLEKAQIERGREATASTTTDDERRATERGPVELGREATASTTTDDERRATERGPVELGREATASTTTDDERRATERGPVELGREATANERQRTSAEPSNETTHDERRVTDRGL